MPSCAEIACWMYTGERQVGALRRRYLEAVLRQDVGFFDTDARTGDVVFSVSTDTLLVQDAIGEKVTDPNPATCVGLCLSPACSEI
jgi:ATP-binding cassette, subfamily B (MDR/TAP), member 1